MKQYAWAIVRPDGHVVADTTWQTEKVAWQNGCEHYVPSDKAIPLEACKAMGYRAMRVRLFEVGPE